jgi:tetratricopeptide (TPR) repeat protein
MVSSMSDPAAASATDAPIVRIYRRTPAAAIAAVQEMFEQRKINAAANGLRTLLALDRDNADLRNLAAAFNNHCIAQAENIDPKSDPVALSELLLAIRLVDPLHAPAKRLAEKLTAKAVRALKIVTKAGSGEMILDGALAVLVLDPWQTDALFAAANVLMETSRAKEAIEPLQRCTEAEPENAWYWLNLGRANHRSGDLLAAANAYLRTIELSAGKGYGEKARVSAAQVLTGLMRQGQQARSRGDLMAARTYFAAVLRIDPTLDAAVTALKATEAELAPISAV